jgi:hypothetical protein
VNHGAKKKPLPGGGGPATAREQVALRGFTPIRFRATALPRRRIPELFQLGLFQNFSLWNSLTYITLFFLDGYRGVSRGKKAENLDLSRLLPYNQKYTDA